MRLAAVRFCTLFAFFPLRMRHDVISLCLREKRQLHKGWDEEWGAIGKEGNIWWLGSGMKGWVDVMGSNRWGWIRECFSVLAQHFSTLVCFQSCRLARATSSVIFFPSF